jgi:hypothetical protein
MQERLEELNKQRDPHDLKKYLYDLVANQASWSEGERKAFWMLNLPTIQTLPSELIAEPKIAALLSFQSKSLMPVPVDGKEGDIVWRPGIKWEGAIYHQCHPANQLKEIDAYLDVLTSGRVTAEDHIELCRRVFSKVPPEAKQYVETLIHLEEYLNGKRLKDLKPAQLLKLLEVINSHLAPDNKGKLRNQLVHVWNTQFFKGDRKADIKRLDDFFNAIKKNNSADFEIYKSSLRKKIWDATAPQPVPQAFTEEEVALMEKYHVAFFPSRPEAVPQLLLQFTLDLSKKLQEGDDGFEIAAFAHQRLTSIHPWIDANGRAARILVGIILYQAGYAPVLYDSEDNYQKMLESEDVQQFAMYLNNLHHTQSNKLFNFKGPTDVLKAVMVKFSKT